MPAPLRSEINLNQLHVEHCQRVCAGERCAQGCAAVQPSSVSLWLCNPNRIASPSLEISKPPPEAVGVREETAEDGV